ncbi:MAG: pyruvate kinase [Candidatus Omnitrophica bacterium]|nr:pyruvate kinase [Candidatus Omnitrophota bacterium]MBU1850796.1 pyruvate kinase [Candidatus Omnitrophota bacterium]
MAKTRIVATLGPASNSYTVIRKMIRGGLNVARLNFSHGSHEDHLKVIKTIRDINRKYKRRVRIMQDLEGFRVRIGGLPGKGKTLKKKDIVLLTSVRDTGDPRTIPIDYKHDLSMITPGQLVYIDDGNIMLEVKSSSKKAFKAEVVEGGLLKSRKGVNMPGVRFPFSGLTAKDKKDLEFGIKHKVDYVAQSFVRRKKDVEMVKHFMTKRDFQCPVVAKIETREAIKNIDSIIDVAGGIMIARGDMGIAVPIYTVPMIQKQIIKKCNREKKPVITATEMLEHMTEHSRPTRAEVTDVANAILDGTDFVMLSEESAAGKYPVESVRMMQQIINYTEANRRI